jgi:hypothetical protein
MNQSAVSGNDRVWFYLLWSLALILTFPAFDMSFSFGIDPCLPWVFHHIQQAGFDKGQEIIFPYGPLTFLMYPLYMNPLPAVFSYVFLALSLYYLLSKLATEKGRRSSIILPFVFSIIILTISGFNLLLFSVIAVSYLGYLKYEKTGYLFFGLILSSLGVFIKINVAILSGVLTFILLIYLLFYKRKYILSASGILLVLISMLLIWTGMYGNFEGFIEYFVGLLHLASGNSSATALFPHNNWLFLSLSLVMLIITFVLTGRRESGKFALIFLLPLFAAWKHGIGRQDYLHYLQFIHFVLILVLLLFSVIRTRRIAFIISGLAAVLFLYLNYHSIKSFPSYTYNFKGPVNFYNLITDFREIKGKAEVKSNNNIKINKLPEQIKDKIANSSVDIYPWDYSIIAANDLNWIPRPGLQSFLGYSTWLDKRNRDHFVSESSPDFIIWHYNPYNSDVNPGRMESVDERYLLNDEPLTLVSILQNYEFLEVTEDFMLLKKRSVALQVEQSLDIRDQMNWNEWLNLPESSGSLIRIKAEFRRNLVGEVMNFLYKDVPVFLVAETTVGIIFRYRIAPGNSDDGIWLSPVIQNFSSETCPYRLERIMFQTGNMNRMKREIPFEIASLSFQSPEGDMKMIRSLFGKTDCLEKEVIFSKEKTLDSDEKTLGPGGYLPAIFFLPDSSVNTDFWIQVGGFVKSGDNKDAKLVLEIFDGEERQFYNSASFSGLYVDSENPSPVLISHKFKAADFDNPLIKAYFWNASDREIEISNLNMHIVRAPDP